LYVKTQGKTRIVIVVLYVQDLLYTGNNDNDC